VYKYKYIYMYDSYDMGGGNWGTSREQIQSTFLFLNQFVYYMYGELVPGFLLRKDFVMSSKWWSLQKIIWLHTRYEK
jgi:hypothetical protein